MQISHVSGAVILSLTLGLLLEFSTVRAQRVQYQLHTFSVRDLYDDPDFPERLTRSSVNQTRSGIRSRSASGGVTLIGTLPLWIFPASAEAALEPEFGTHSSITGVSVPVSRLPCIPSIGGLEYQRLTGIRNRLYGKIVREFSEINNWLVGPETNLIFVDCEGKNLGVNDMVRFFVDALEGIYPIIKRENPSARVIAHFLGDPWIPILIQGQLVQPSAIRNRIREEIQLRNGNSADYYDVLAETLDPSLARDRAPENIPPVDFSAATASGSENPSPARSAETSTPAPGWQVKWVEEFETSTSTPTDDQPEYGLVAEYKLWNKWRTNECKIQLAITEVVNKRAIIQLTTPAPNMWAVGGAVTMADANPEPDTTSDSDIVPDAEVGGDATSRHRWTAVQDFYATDKSANSGGAHAAVFLRVRDRVWSSYTIIETRDGRRQTVPCEHPTDWNQTRFGAFVYGPNPNSNCGNVWCGTLEIVGDNAETPDYPATSPNEGKEGGIQKLFHFPLKRAANESLLWDDRTGLYRLQIVEEKRPSAISSTGSMLYWKAQVWKNPGATDTAGENSAELIGESEWISEETLMMHRIKTPKPLEGSKITIGLGPLKPGQISIGIDTERVGTAYWRYSD